MTTTELILAFIVAPILVGIWLGFTAMVAHR